MKYSTVATATVIVDKDLDLEKLFSDINGETPSLASEVVLADIELTKDVIPFSSILVSNIWNKNDDVFSSGELVKAINTPKFKPINWMHKGSETRGNQNIGVMVAPSLLEGSLQNLELVEADRFEDLTDSQALDGELHIRQDGLIWSSYFPSYSNAIAEGIENDDIYVSMECFFDDFGFALRTEEDSPIALIDRTPANEGLIKALRINGGSGKAKINGKTYLVGRWLKDITFSGQGIVDQPANTLGDEKLSIVIKQDVEIKENEEPVVLNFDLSACAAKSSSNSELGYNSVESEKENNKGNEMSDKQDTTIADLQAKLDTVVAERDDALKRAANLEATELNSKYDAVVAEKEGLEAQVKELTSRNEDLETKAGSVSAIEAERDELKKELDSANAQLAEIQAVEKARVRLEELQAIAGDSYTDEDLDTIKDWSDEVFAIVKDNLTKAGVSSLPKSTDQTVSSEPKSTDQTVSTETKSTEAAVAEEATEVISEAEVDESENADLHVSNDENEESGAVAKALFARALNK